MYKHDWTQSHIEHGALFQGIMTVVQFYSCRLCREVIGLPLAVTPIRNGCSGLKIVPKLPWKSPNKKK